MDSNGRHRAIEAKRSRTAYDANRQRVVLFGGSSNSGLVGDTWEWDGEQWTQLGDTGPLPRSGHALTCDSGRQRIVLFGGVLQNNVALADTWI